MTEYRWVSCSREMSWSTAQYRHLIIKGGLTTLCGSTASEPKVWRGNSTKVKCLDCIMEAEYRMLRVPY